MDSSIVTWPVAETGEIAVSPDGTLIATTSAQSISLYDMETGKLVHGPLRGGSTITAVAFSPDSRMVASSSWSYVCIWDTTTGKEVCCSGGHAEWILSVVFSRDSRIIISGSLDKTIRLLNVQGRQEIAGSPIQVGSKVYAVDVSPDGTKLAAGTETSIVLYDTATWLKLRTWFAHTSSVYPMAFSPDGARIVSASRDHKIRLWDVDTGLERAVSFVGNMEGVTSLAFSPSGKYIAAGLVTKAIHIWDTNSGALYCSPLHGHGAGIYGVAYHPDGRRLVSGSSDQTIKSWDVGDKGEHQEVLSPKPQRTEADSINIKSLPDIISSLRIRGCSDMSALLDMSTCGEYPISSGGFGDIYRCKLRNGIEVAVKTIRLYVGSSDQEKKHLKHVAQELYAWSKCKHVYVQPLLGMGMFRGQVGMIAEWQANGTMLEYLEQHPHTNRCVLGARIAEGLSYLHVSGVVHGDLKSGNVLISKEGFPLLADFGNAKLQEYTLKFTKTSTKETLSSRWAAPELFEGALCSVKTDVYALGMTILEAITGEVPWPNQSERAVMFAVMFKRSHPDRPEAHIPTYSEHGDTLWSLLKCCWEGEPGKRPNAEQVKLTMSSITQASLKSKEIDMNDVEMA